MNTFLLLMGGVILLPFFFKTLIKRFGIILVLIVLLGLTTKKSVDTTYELETLIETIGVEFPRVVIAQGILESGFFQSPIYRENNNWLGMKCASIRKTHCVGTSRGHAIYLSTLACLKDYKLWQENTFRKEIERGNKLPTTEEEYIDLLIKYNYAEDKDYKKKIKKIIRIFLTEKLKT